MSERTMSVYSSAEVQIGPTYPEVLFYDDFHTDQNSGEIPTNQIHSHANLL
jgi:hypothetical protein